MPTGIGKNLHQHSSLNKNYLPPEIRKITIQVFPLLLSLVLFTLSWRIRNNVLGKFSKMKYFLNVSYI